VTPEEARPALLALLNRLYVPTTVDDLVLCGSVVGTAGISSDLVEEVAASDLEEFLAGVERPAWVCPALDYPGGLSNEEFLTRSDWPLRTRVVPSFLSEGQELMLLRQLCDIAMSALEKGFSDRADVRALLERIDDLTIHVPEQLAEETSARRGLQDDHLTLYRELAEDLYGDVIEKDRRDQSALVAEFSELPDRVKFFGRN
jgi:hypothetical protein